MSERFFVNTTEFVRNSKFDETIPPDRFAPMTGRKNYRSAKIVSYNQLKMLKQKYGIKRVINLALDSVDFQSDPNFNCGGRRVPCEPLWAEALGLEYYPFYMTSSWRLSDERWEIIKDLLSKGNTLIHCTHGVDRTGGIAAGWRKTVEPNLTNEDVLENYTYKFGGQWQSAGDGNRNVRRWVKSVEYDPTVKVAKRQVKAWWFSPLVFIGLPLLFIVMQKKPKRKKAITQK